MQLSGINRPPTEEYKCLVINNPSALGPALPGGAVALTCITRSIKPLSPGSPASSVKGHDRSSPWTTSHTQHSQPHTLTSDHPTVTRYHVCAPVCVSQDEWGEGGWRTCRFYLKSLNVLLIFFCSFNIYIYIKWFSHDHVHTIMIQTFYLTPHWLWAQGGPAQLSLVIRDLMAPSPGHIELLSRWLVCVFFCDLKCF